MPTSTESKKCLICNNNTKIISHPRYGDYYICSQCQFISKDSRFFLSPELEAIEYAHHTNSMNDPKYQSYFDTFIQSAILPIYTLQNRLKAKNALDYGSGPEPVLATLLTAKYGIPTDYYDPFFAPNSLVLNQMYDLITATEVLEHLDNPLESLINMVGMLKPAGILAIQTQFHYNQVDRFLTWNYIRDLTHISFYNLETFKYIGLKMNLKIEYTDNRRYITFSKGYV